MDMTRAIDRFLAAICAAAIVIFCMAGVVFSAFAEDKTGTLTLWCANDDDIVEGMHWRIYRIGHRTANDYVFEGDFAGYRATLGDKSKPMLDWSTETVAAAGEALKRKAIADSIPFRSEGYTDSKGSLSFSGLEKGLYLVCGDVLEKDDVIYIPSALFFEMTGEDTSVLNAYPKIILRRIRSGGSHYSVRKVWDNSEDQTWDENTPITVEIYRDNVLYDEIKLSESNNWTYSWDDKEDHDWFVYERELLGSYTVAYFNNQTQFIIVNTYDSTIEPPDNPPGTTTTTGIVSDITTTSTTADIDADNDNAKNTTTASSDGKGSGKGNTTTASGNKNGSGRTEALTTQGDKKLPQTGQLWWPVIPLTCGGVLLLGAGIMLTKKEDDE